MATNIIDNLLVKLVIHTKDALDSLNGFWGFVYDFIINFNKIGESSSVIIGGKIFLVIDF